METVLVQINDNKAYKLLQDLEELHIIKVLKKDIQLPMKLSEKYRGVFSKEDAKNFNEYIQTVRKQWDNT
jgi:beta-glucosidase/6-phospho-beta-glucosidase/beta-galactosidase